MEDPSKSSFIPKRDPAGKKKRNGPVRHIYLFTIIGYILVFATLLSSGGVYIYGSYVDGQLNTEIVALDSEIKTFSKADMQKVIDFDSRLTQASDIMKKGVSFISVLESLEAATINTVKIISLNAERDEDDNKYIVVAKIETDSFDSAMFQRDVYKHQKPIVESVKVSDLATIEITSLEEAIARKVELGELIVTFVTELGVPLSSIPHTPNKESIQQPVVISEEITPVSEAEVDALDTNEENI
ncbi:MAG: hypothetical protein ACI9BF_000378 [Candidatus Paceibacteria bacterium]|jgi:hypothetical protein